MTTTPQTSTEMRAAQMAYADVLDKAIPDWSAKPWRARARKKTLKLWKYPPKAKFMALRLGADKHVLDTAEALLFGYVLEPEHPAPNQKYWQGSPFKGRPLSFVADEYHPLEEVLTKIAAMRSNPGGNDAGT